MEALYKSTSFMKRLCSETQVRFAPAQSTMSKSKATGKHPQKCMVVEGRCNSPPINGQCTNHRIAVGPLLCGVNVPFKGLTLKSPHFSLQRLTKNRHLLTNMKHLALNIWMTYYNISVEILSLTVGYWHCL